MSSARSVRAFVEVPAEDGLHARRGGDAVDEVPGARQDLPSADAVLHPVGRGRADGEERHVADEDEGPPLGRHPVERGDDLLGDVAEGVVEDEEPHAADLAHRRGQPVRIGRAQLRQDGQLLRLLLVRGAAAVLVVADAGEVGVGLEPALGVLQVRRGDEVHEIARVDDPQPARAGVRRRLVEVVGAELAADARAPVGERVPRGVVPAVDRHEVRVGDVEDGERTREPEFDHVAVDLQRRNRLVGERGTRAERRARRAEGLQEGAARGVHSAISARPISRRRALTLRR